MKSKKLLSVAMALTMTVSGWCGLSMSASAEAAVKQFYVATNGSDSNSGSISAPFATLEAARDAARKVDGKVIINLREGMYQVDSTLELTAADSNTTYRAYKDESVVLNGANELDPSAFQPISEEAKAKLVDKENANKIKMIDLKAQGITEYGSLKCMGFGNYRDNGSYPAALYYENQMMTVARYPNDGYVETGDVLDAGENGTEKGFTAKVDTKTASRMKNWADAKDVWVFGYFIHDWAEAHLPIASMDASKGTITTGWASNFGVVPERRYYFYNLLEELDAPGEWYLDRDTGVLYLYPATDMKADSTVEFITFDKPFIEAKGAENVTFKNIALKNGIGQGIVATDVKNFVVDGCELSNISNTAIQIGQSDDAKATTSNSGVKNSYLHDLGSAGISISAGEKKGLTPGNCFATNNHIERFSRIKTTYCAGITLLLVGNKADHNEINDAPHFAIQYKDNDHVIEYNNIYKVCTDTADSGAIYTGRDWTARGNEIRYNYFHDMDIIGTKTNMKVQAVYLDDMHSSTAVHGNIFYKVSSVALYGGGRNNTFVNNLMLECKAPFVFDSRGTPWSERGIDWLNPQTGSIYQRLKAVPYKEGIWAEKYPELVNILDDEPLLPKYNVISGNVIYKTPAMDLNQDVVNNGTVENNITVSNTKGFTDYKNQDFSLVKDGDILNKIPDFEIVDYKSIGRYDVTDQDTDFEEEGAAANTIQLTIGSDKLQKGDETVTLDVPAQTINDRTMGPLRAIFEALGATVDWEEATQTVTSTKGDLTIKLTIGSNKLYRGDEEVTLDVPAQVVNDRTLVPVRAISESFGCQVDWDEATQTVTIHVQ